MSHGNIVMDEGFILITGASGGFGYEFARQLEARGACLILHGRDTARLQMTLDGLKHPDRHRCLIADLSQRKSVESFIDSVQAEGKIIGLVNNAGFGVWGKFELCESVPQLDVLRTDLMAPVSITHALLPELIRVQGFIVNVSSLAGEIPLPYMSTYAAAKAGLTCWSEALRAEVAGKVTVVTLVPGPSPTGFRDISGAPKGKGRGFRTSAQTVVAASLSTLQRGGGYCVPGWRHRLLWLLQKVTPRKLSLKLMADYLKP
ncbi:MAG TPA: SDR family NAD(P)-dependent oxidoreductase [Mariprofundaceae bacterium]|nr:SDR family NAD(P)-dependent oxidoreductase [Mariprofundaceae bacterium]